MYYSDVFLFFLMRRRPPRSKRTDTLFPDTTLCRSIAATHLLGESVTVGFFLFAVIAQDMRPLGEGAVHQLDHRLPLLLAEEFPRGQGGGADLGAAVRSEEHTSELQSLMRISYAVFCLKKTRITVT